MLFYILSNLYILAYATYTVNYGAEPTDEELETSSTYLASVIYPLKIMYFSSGIIMPFMRVSEPYFFYIIREKWVQWTNE